MVTEEKCNSSSNGVNGFLRGSSSRSDGARDGSSFRTYKRRKCVPSSNCKVIDLEEKLSCSPSARGDDKMVKELVDLGLQKNSCQQVCDRKINCHSLLNGSDDCSYQHWRKVLESICQSLSPTEGGSGGIQGCIRDALLNNHRNNHATMDKISGTTNGSSTAAKGHSAVTSNGSSSESGHSTASRLCERAFFKLVMSGEFASLCKLLSENFHGLKIDKFLDFSLINSRIKEGAYERTPMLFSSDIQQIWRRLYSIGNEMVSLSNNLSKLSRGFCLELGGGAEPAAAGDRKLQLVVWHPDVQVKREEPDASAFCTCRQCGEKSDGRDCLVCDSCEGMFHVSCIEPAIKEIPHKSWYCASCTASGFGSPHEDCVVCERLNAKSEINEADTVPMYEETIDDDEDSSDGIVETGLQVFKGSKRLPCKVCGSILTNGEEFRVCEHRFCQYKYYHTRCMTNKELQLYGPRWYCPSCLCRVCLTDKDDNDLVMCDGCDHGYHIYCMNPPRTSIPRGKWFCPKCDAGIKAIRKVKKFYEDLERKQKRNNGKRVVDGSSKKSKPNFEDAPGGSGGMDMLLNAARTLNDEEEFKV